MSKLGGFRKYIGISYIYKMFFLIGDLGKNIDLDSGKLQTGLSHHLVGFFHLNARVMEIFIFWLNMGVHRSNFEKNCQNWPKSHMPLF